MILKFLTHWFTCLYERECTKHYYNLNTCNEYLFFLMLIFANKRYLFITVREKNNNIIFLPTKKCFFVIINI